MKTTYLLLLINISSLFATDYYVSSIQGNDGNNGISENTSFRTLSKIQGINLQPGDSIFLMDGTYENSGGSLLVIDESGTPNAWITIQNYPGHRPLLKFDSWTGIDLINGASYIAFKGLRIQGARSKITLEEALAQPGSCENDLQGNPQGLYNGTGILAVGPNLKWSNGATTGNEIPHHILIENCEIFDCTSSGVAFQQSDYITIRNNKIYNNAWYTLYGTSGVNFYQFINTDETTGVHNEVSNNLMYGNQLKVPQLPSCQFYDGNALIVDDFKHLQTGNYLDPTNGFDSYTAQTIIKNNVVVENGGSGLHFYLSSNCLIYNNTVVNNAFQNDGNNGNGDLRIGSCSNFEVKNNIFKGETRVNAVGGNTEIIYSHNYHEGPGILLQFQDCESCIDEGIILDNIDITSIAPFISYSESILKDTGETIPEVTDDYLQKIRPTGNGMDIGAYELGACAFSTWYADNDGDGVGSLTDSIDSCEQPFGYVDISGDQCDNDPDKIKQDVWYADADGDGLGSITDKIEACEQPSGYTAESGDQCDTDPNKTVPGECGCGIEEGTCTGGTDNCTSPNFEINTVYSQSGTVVTYLGKAYKNKWYTKGALPTNGEPWVLIEVCDSSGEDCSSIDDWSSSTTYSNPGNEINYNGSVYKNKWYSLNDIPGEKQVWELVNVCAVPSNLKTAMNKESGIQILTDEFKAYPTICNSNITIETSFSTRILIFNTLGQLVKSNQVIKGKNVLDMTNIGKGLHFIHHETSTLSNVIRIIKR